MRDQPSTPETRSKVRALTEALQRERERCDVYLSTFQDVPSAHGKIATSWFMTHNNPVKIKRWVCSNGKVVNLEVTMIIKPLEDKFDAVTLQLPSIPLAEVTRVFVPDDKDLDASGKAVVQVLPQGSPAFSPTSPDFSPSLLPGEAAFNAILAGAMSPMLLGAEGDVENIPDLGLGSVDPKDPQTRSKSLKAPKQSTKVRASPY